jgi:hypothetical protein
MVACPVETPVNTPTLVIVALGVAEEIQGLETAGVAVPVSVILPPTHTVLFPLIVGFALTVIVAVLEQPSELV